jgi:SH3 domain protein
MPQIPCEIVVRSESKIAGRNIIKVLPSGAPIEVRDMDDTWATVRLEDGRTGYVEKRHLIDREPYKVTAERLQLEVGQQRERLATLTQQLTTLRDEHQRLQKVSSVSERNCRISVRSTSNSARMPPRPSFWRPEKSMPTCSVPTLRLNNALPL